MSRRKRVQGFRFCRGNVTAVDDCQSIYIRWPRSIRLSLLSNNIFLYPICLFKKIIIVAGRAQWPSLSAITVRLPLFFFGRRRHYRKFSRLFRAKTIKMCGNKWPKTFLLSVKKTGNDRQMKLSSFLQLLSLPFYPHFSLSFLLLNGLAEGKTKINNNEK